jgi:hypothetical protein
MPGSPITNAVASVDVKPSLRLRPPSPAIGQLMPSRPVPGSPIKRIAVASALVKPTIVLRPQLRRAVETRCLRQSPAKVLLAPTPSLPGSPFHS